ncbi:hypothetical protein NKH18_13020 [Streptomyces sp. M10(2022)]
MDWFHKYRVLAVVTTDPAGQNEAVEHAYEYGARPGTTAMTRSSPRPSGPGRTGAATAR